MGVKVTDNITPQLKALLERAKSKQAAFARIYPVYQAAQLQRFVTENSSEGAPWDKLDPKYAEYKLRRYGGGARRASKKRPAGEWRTWPGAGRKMLIGTSSLAGAVIGPGDHGMEGVDHHRAIFTDTSMTIRVDTGGVNAEGSQFEYPEHVAEHRPFFVFSDATEEQMRDQMRRYIVGRP